MVSENQTPKRLKMSLKTTKVQTEIAKWICEAESINTETEHLETALNANGNSKNVIKISMEHTIKKPNDRNLKVLKSNIHSKKILNMGSDEIP